MTHDSAATPDGEPARPDGGPGKSPRPDPVAAAAAAGVPITPELLRQLMPRPKELLRAQRRATWMLAGCFTLIILAILATLFIPWWQYKQQGRELVKAHLLLIRDGQLDDAVAQSGLPHDEFVDMVEKLRLRELMAGEAVIQIDDFTAIDGEAVVVGVIRPANNAPPRGFRARVFIDPAEETMKVERIMLVE